MNFHLILASVRVYHFNPLIFLPCRRLDSNALVCDCQMMWLTKMLQDKQDSSQFTATCRFPSHMEGKPLALINEEDLHCGKSAREFQRCVRSCDAENLWVGSTPKKKVIREFRAVEKGENYSTALTNFQFQTLRNRCIHYSGSPKCIQRRSMITSSVPFQQKAPTTAIKLSLIKWWTK